MHENDKCFVQVQVSTSYDECVIFGTISYKPRVKWLPITILWLPIFIFIILLYTLRDTTKGTFRAKSFIIVFLSELHIH